MLITLEQHDELHTQAFQEQQAKSALRVPTGIQCPECPGELVNPTPDEIILEDVLTIGAMTVPRINVTCDQPDCDYTGTAVQPQ